VLVEPREFVIVEGLLPLHTKLSRACFDVSVYLDPPEEIRTRWKVKRDCGERGYAPEAVHAELRRREPESAAFIRPQRAEADIVIRFAPIPGRGTPLPNQALSAELVLRPTIRHPDLDGVIPNGISHDPDGRPAMHLRLARDTDGRPVDALHVHGDVPAEDSAVVEKAIWGKLGQSPSPPQCLGQLSADEQERSEPLAITQLLLLHHLLGAGT